MAERWSDNQDLLDDLHCSSNGHVWDTLDDEERYVRHCSCGVWAIAIIAGYGYYLDWWVGPNKKDVENAVLVAAVVEG
jgi:hypothetical protein